MKFNLNQFIEKVAGQGPGAFNKLTAARVGVDNFDLKTAAQLIGKAVFTKRAEYNKINEGIDAFKNLRK